MGFNKFRARLIEFKRKKTIPTTSKLESPFDDTEPDIIHSEPFIYRNPVDIYLPDEREFLNQDEFYDPKTEYDPNAVLIERIQGVAPVSQKPTPKPQEYKTQPPHKTQQPYATLESDQKLYEIFKNLPKQTILTTNNLALPENERAFREFEANVQKNPTFRKIQIRDYIIQKKLDKSKIDGTQRSRSRSYRVSGKESIGNIYHRPPGKNGLAGTAD